MMSESKNRLLSLISIIALWPCFPLQPEPAHAEDSTTGRASKSQRLQGRLEGDGITDQWFGLRSSLSDRGVDPFAIWTGEVFRNFDGGLQTRTDWTGLLEFGTNVDLEKVIGWNAAKFHVSALWLQGNDDSSTEYVGNFDEISNIAGKANIRIFQLYLSQQLRDGTFRLKIGGYYASGDRTNYQTGNESASRFAFYIVFDQILVGTRSENHLAAFFRLGWSPLEDRSQIFVYFDGGLTAQGFRKSDRFGLAVSHAEFGKYFVDAQAADGSPIVDDGTVIELTYRAQLTPWFVLQPDFQYLLDPQNAAASDAVVAGVRAEITF
jgi:carbohydrate-selective porin OprB